MATKVETTHNYADYIKCGEILKSPLDNYQLSFILKCYECSKIHFVLESFINHIQDHCKTNFILREDIEGSTITQHDVEESEQVEKLSIKLEEDGAMETEDPLVVIKTEADDESNKVNDNEVESGSEHHELFEDIDLNTDNEFQTDDAESEDDEIESKTIKKRKKILPDIVSTFIKSKKNIKTLIEIYKNQPNLWNKNYPLYRFKDKRQTILEEVTRDVNIELNLKLTWKEISELITYLRGKHREEYKRLQYHKTKDHYNKKYKISWFFEDLNFLRSESVIQLNKIDKDLPNLTTEQIIKIMQIYKDYPHLWNSNLIEFICSNKRHDSYIDMLKSLESNINLKVSKHNLEEYLRTIHNYFSSEKRYRTNFNNNKQAVDKRTDDYYEHLLYLYDHEGPFQCTDCNRIYSKPLGFKVHRAHHNNSPPFICSQCNKEFKGIQSYTNHAKRHLEDYEFICTECDKKFVKYQDLKVHLLTHSEDRPYCCEICGASYRYVQGFKRHQRRHEKRFSHTCHICSKGYYSKDRYDDHMNSHMNIRSHICKLCGKGFITSRALKTHTVTHEDVRNHACKLCGKTFKLKIGVLQHMRTHGSKFEIEYKNIEGKTTKKRKKVLPDIVSTFIKSKKNIKTLIEIYKNQPNLWNKNHPLYRFKDKRQTILEEVTRDVNKELNLKLTCKEISELITYLRGKHGEEYKRVQYHKDKDHNDKKYKLSWFFEELHFLRPESKIQLNKIDKNLPNLTTEQIIKIMQIYKEYPHLWNSNLIEFICSNKRHDSYIDMLKNLESNMNLKVNKSTLEDYLRTIHNYFSREKRCRTNFANNKEAVNKRTDDYYEHLLYLYDHEGPFQCADCNRIYSKPLGFKVHMARHKDSAPLVCSQCNKEFKSIPSYTTHAKRHLDDFEFICKECDKKFVNYQDLKVHLLTHSGDRPYCCEICGASYRHVQCFKRHQRRHEKRFSHTCHICSKGYYSKDRYDDHMNSHMNIRSHICKLCGKGFITSRALKTHAVTHEDVRNHACKLCGKTFKLKIGVLQHMRTHGSKVEVEDKN